MNETNTIGGFKKFVRSSNRIIDKISVTSGGAIGFSTSFANEHELSKFTGVILYWNSDTKEIGIQFTSEEGEDIIKLMTNAHASGRTANAKSFFALNRIEIEKYKGRKSYRIATFNQIDLNNPSTEKMYIIRLDEGVTPNPAVTTPPAPVVNETPADQVLTLQPPAADPNPIVQQPVNNPNVT